MAEVEAHHGRPAVPARWIPGIFRSTRAITSDRFRCLGLFFIWVGVVMLTGLPWTWFLMGAQSARWQRGLNIETIGVFVGLIVLAAAIWDLLALPWPLMPIALIMLGAYLLWKTLSPRSESQ